jgi:hypothetical protein
MPELSFGTHFFQDLVEGDIFYVALFPQKEDVTFDRAHLLQMPNSLAEAVPEADKYAEVVYLYEFDGERLQIVCDVLTQRVICFFS